jgi:hypothetical protein
MKKLFTLLAWMAVLCASSSYAAKVCKKDSLAYMPSTGSLSGNLNLGRGVSWSVLTDYGEIRGVAKCSGSNSDKNNIAYGDSCWCRIISPRLGAWVFHFDHPSVDACHINCVQDCAYCMTSGSHVSCTRSALLAAP